MKKILIFLFLMSVASITSLHAQNRLTIKLNGLESKKGTIYTALFNTPNSFMKEAETYRTNKIVVHKKTAEIIFDNLPDGEYACAIFHDTNNNNSLDRDVLHLPIEKYGFSNNALPIGGFPEFSTCKFQVKENTIINITLQYLKLYFQVK